MQIAACQRRRPAYRQSRYTKTPSSTAADTEMVIGSASLHGLRRSRPTWPGVPLRERAAPLPARPGRALAAQRRMVVVQQRAADTGGLVDGVAVDRHSGPPLVWSRATRLP